MKRIFRGLFRILCFSLVISLAAVMFPYVRSWVAEVMPQGKYDRLSTQLTHEMEKAGELTALRLKDTGVMTATTDALFIGSVQEVKAPYAYEIGLGIDLTAVSLTASDTGILVSVPPAQMLYDSFQITGDPEIRDFWYRLTEARYQEMINAQAAACRSTYLENEDQMENAWRAACEALEKLMAQWADQALPLTFVQTEKMK